MIKQKITKFLSVSILLMLAMGIVSGMELGGTCTSDDSIFVHSKEGVLVERSLSSIPTIWEDFFIAGSMIECRDRCHLEKKCKSAAFNTTENKCMLKDISRVDLNIKITVTPDLEYFEKVPLCGTTEKLIAIVDQVIDCKDTYNKGWRQTGIYAIPIAGERAYEPVLCEMTLFGGGWTVFQSRVDGTVPFDKDWASYREGFGNLSSNFWYGNERIHQLTWTTDSVLLFELLWPTRNIGTNSITFYPSHHGFKIASENEDYALALGEFEDMDPSVGGTYTSRTNNFEWHNGQPFSTRDHDSNGLDCSAQRSNSGWWFNDCSSVSLNGEYGDQSTGVEGDNGIVWDSLTYDPSQSPIFTYFKKTRMMFRRK